MEDLPERTTGDYAHAIAKAVVGAVPIAGSALTGLMETVFAPPLERRRDRWLSELASVVEQLVEKIGPAALASNDAFVTSLVQATQIAYRTHQTEKIAALRAAVYNSAMPGAPSDDRQSMFLRLVDELTATHLRVLALYEVPATWIPVPDYPDDGWSRSASSEQIFKEVPSLEGNVEFYEQVARDLQVRSLTQQGLLTHFRIVERGVLEPKTTELGKALLSFISTSAA